MSGIFDALGEISWFYLWMWQEDGDDERLSSSWLNPVEGTLLVKEPSAYKVLKFFFTFRFVSPSLKVQLTIVTSSWSLQHIFQVKKKNEEEKRESVPLQRASPEKIDILLPPRS